jgi:hypothetical protein
VKTLISDLFVEESQFDGKGFEMIEHINKYFNPFGTVDSLSHIFDLIDIKQAQDESIITLKARFSCVFARLKMGGIAIDLASRLYAPCPPDHLPRGSSGLPPWSSLFGFHHTSIGG